MICHTRCRARSFSGDAHCTNMTHSLLGQVFESASWKLQSILSTTNIKIYTTKKCVPCTPPQVDHHSRCRVVLPSCRRAGPSSGRIVTLHVLEQVPLSTPSNVPRRSRPDFASVNTPIGFVGTVLLIPVVWSHNRLTINLRKRFSLCNYVKQQIYSRHKTLFSKKDFSCHLAAVTTVWSRCFILIFVNLIVFL